MSLVQWVDFHVLGDERGSLISLEANRNVPFDIKRVYYIFGTKEGVSRGYHAHKALRQIVICLSGQCDVRLDNGLESELVRLDSPHRGILVEGMVWREMHDFSSGCVLMVLASDVYEESDYIRSYNEFITQVSI